MRESQRGSVLLLFPAAVVVFLVLGAIAVDFGGAWAAERELANAAAAAANDAASKAIDLDVLYATGEIRLRSDDARFVAERSVATRSLTHLDATVTAVEVDGARVRVTVAGRAPQVFGRALGRADGVAVSASAEAVAVTGPPSP